MAESCPRHHTWAPRFNVYKSSFPIKHFPESESEPNQKTMKFQSSSHLLVLTLVLALAPVTAAPADTDDTKCQADEVVMDASCVLISH